MITTLRELAALVRLQGCALSLLWHREQLARAQRGLAGAQDAFDRALADVRIAQHAPHPEPATAPAFLTRQEQQA